MFVACRLLLVVVSRVSVVLCWLSFVVWRSLCVLFRLLFLVGFCVLVVGV